MLNHLSILKPSALRDLVDAGMVSHPRVIAGGDDGLVILLRVADSDMVLGHAKRPGTRHFKYMDGATNVLKGYGLSKFEVDVTDWIPRLQKKQQGEESMKE